MANFSQLQYLFAAGYIFVDFVTFCIISRPRLKFSAWKTLEFRLSFQFLAPPQGIGLWGRLGREVYSVTLAFNFLGLEKPTYQIWTP